MRGVRHSATTRVASTDRHSWETGSDSTTSVQTSPMPASVPPTLGYGGPPNVMSQASQTGPGPSVYAYPRIPPPHAAGASIFPPDPSRSTALPRIMPFDSRDSLGVTRAARSFGPRPHITRAPASRPSHANRPLTPGKLRLLGRLALVTNFQQQHRLLLLSTRGPGRLQTSPRPAPPRALRPGPSQSLRRAACPTVAPSALLHRVVQRAARHTAPPHPATSL